MQCKNCKFAEWDRTATGRLSPTGRGCCTWEKTIQVPPYSQTPGEAKTVLELKNRMYLWRSNNNMPNCPVGIPVP